VQRRRHTGVAPVRCPVFFCPAARPRWYLSDGSEDEW
jgi:hypothetical protein